MEKGIPSKPNNKYSQQATTFLKRKRLLFFLVDEIRCAEHIILLSLLIVTIRFILLFGNLISVNEIYLVDKI